MLPKYKRVLVKLSGESLMGDKNFGMDPVIIEQYARDIKEIVRAGRAGCHRNRWWKYLPWYE